MLHFLVTLDYHKGNKFFAHLHHFTNTVIFWPSCKNTQLAMRVCFYVCDNAGCLNYYI